MVTTRASAKALAPAPAASESTGAFLVWPTFVVCNAAFVAYIARIIPTLTVHDPALVSYIITGILALGGFQVFMHVTGLGAAPTGKFNSGTLALPVGLPVGVAWWTMEQPAFLVPLASLLCYLGDGGEVHPGVLLLGMPMAHYLQRAYIYPWLSRGSNYPLHAWASAMAFCIANGTAQANDLLYGPTRAVPWSALYSTRAVLGFALFAFGMAANIHSDYILRSLRAPGSREYRIPRGGLFEYVSGAHFVGEIIEWSGYAVACNFATAPLAFAAFNWMGIGTRAMATHAWNLRTFGDKYPKDRKKLVPFVW